MSKLRVIRHITSDGDTAYQNQWRISLSEVMVIGNSKTNDDVAYKIDNTS